MEFYLTSYVDGSKLHFPIPPQENAPTNRSVKKVTFTPLDFGTRSFPRGMNEKTTQLHGRLPAYAGSRVKDWRAPGQIVALFERWMTENHRLAYLVAGAPRTSSFDVYVAEFNDDPATANGDISYTLTLCQWGVLTVPTDAEPDEPLPGEEGAPETPTASEPEPLVEQPADPPGDTYVVQPGDSLWEIAAMTWGDGSLWPSLYEANRETVGDNPNLIFPGQTLTIPHPGGAQEQAEIDAALAAGETSETEE